MGPGFSGIDQDDSADLKSSGGYENVILYIFCPPAGLSVSFQVMRPDDERACLDGRDE